MGRRLWLVIFVAPAISGCGADEAVGGSSSAHALDPAFDPVMSAYCDSLWRCDWPGLLELRILAGSPERCRALVYRSRDSAWNRDLEHAIADGRVRILAPNVDACVLAIEACTPYTLSNSSPCGALFEGTLAEGASCQRTEECDGDAYCRSDDRQCPGTCTRRTSPGGRCKSSQECGAATHAIPLCVSSPGATGGTCTEIPILASAALGARCTLTSTGMPLVPCEPGLWCDHDFPADSGVCRAPIAIGQPCAARDVCAGDAFCQESRGLCQLARVGHEAGDACDPDAHLWCDALENLTCVDGRCQVIGDGSLGSSCDPGELYTGVCDEGLHCRPHLDRPFGTCAVPGEEGAACSAGSDCVSGSCDLDGTCAAGYCAPY